MEGITKGKKEGRKGEQEEKRERENAWSDAESKKRGRGEGGQKILWTLKMGAIL